ncbi:Vacuole morphology and inheritance protein 14, partial [Dioscorea alata]
TCKFPNFFTSCKGLNFDHLAKSLLCFALSNDQFTQLTALTWINELRKFGKHQLASHYSDILAVVLHCFSNAPKNICEIAHEINEGIREEYPVLAERSNINTILSALTRGLRLGKDIQIETWRWIIELLSWHRAEVISYFGENFDSLMKALSDSSDKVVPFVLKAYARIVGDAELFHRLFSLLFQKLHSDSLLDRRGFLIVSHLCALLNAEQVYRKFSSLIEGEDNLEFASEFVQKLNSILITSSNLASMRALLKQTLVSAAGKDLFLSLYSSWCHSTRATISLCLLSQVYRHANCVILSMVEEDRMMKPLIGATIVVFWLELPSFAHIKQQLLEDGKNVWLKKLLYHLIMLLPRNSEAFKLLLGRLGSLPKHNSVGTQFECASCGHQHLEILQLADPDDENQDTGNTKDAIDFASLLKKFMHIQRKFFNHLKTKMPLQHLKSASS